MALFFPFDFTFFFLFFSPSVECKTPNSTISIKLKIYSYISNLIFARNINSTLKKNTIIYDLISIQLQFQNMLHPQF